MRPRVVLPAAVLVAVLVAGLVLLLGGPDPVRVTASFPDAVGLYPGNRVAVLGVPVGTVTGVRPAGTRVLVDLELDPDVPVPADVTAVTLSPSLVTDRRVELSPPYRGGPVLRDGDVIGPDRTRTPVEIDRVFAAADRLSSQLNAVTAPDGRPAVADLLGTLRENLAGNGDRLRATLAGLAGAVGVGADRRDELVELIERTDRITGAAAANDGRLRSFTTNLGAATALADEQGPQLVAILRDAADVLERSRAILGDNREQIRAVVENLRATARTAAGRTRELAEGVDVLPTAFSNLAAVVDPRTGRARVHSSIDEVFVNNDLLTDICRNRLDPALCPGGAPTSALGLLLGGLG